MLKIFMIAIVILLLLIAVMVAIGFSLPKKHIATRVVTLHQRPEAVFALISNFKEAPGWRNNVKQVEVLPSPEGKMLFRETSSDGTLTMEVVESRPPGRLVTRIADKGLPFGGYWIYEIIPTKEGCQLNITEHGEIYNPIFRFVSRFFLGYTRTLDAYLKNVANKFSENIEITNGQPANL